MSNPLDTKVDRRNTNSMKWEFVEREGDPHHWDHTDRFLSDDPVLPMWVADMDFRCPEPVVEALVRRAQHGIFGYSMPTADFYSSVVGWMKRRHGWTIDPEWICVAPGVVPALNMLLRAVISPGDGVLIQPPVYYPFRTAILHNGGEVVNNPLVYEGGRYRMDFDDLEAKVRDPKVKAAILCSPHNPVGRVWSRDELQRFGELCLDHDVLVISDEIHGDLIMKGSTFTPFATVDERFLEHCVICTAPSKTFNLAGLQTSCIIIPDAALRTRFLDVVESNALKLPNSFGIVALQAAYDHGEPWLEQVLDYIQGNLEFLEDYIRKNIPKIKVVRPEGTYLVWLDCRLLGVDDKALNKLLLEKARVYLDDGLIFGAEGSGFQRINIACSRAVLEQALGRIRKTVTALS